MKRLLVIRFSALGDVAMTLPVMRRVLEESPKTEITFVTRSQFAPLFENIERLRVIGVDLNRDYKGITGLFKLASYLKTQCRPDACIDLHQVLRTHLTCLFLRISGIPCFKIKKDRHLKRKMIRTKDLQPLPHTTERYLDAFREYGLNLPASSFILPSVVFSEKDQRAADEFLTNASLHCIAFAPFAKHETKTLPIHISENIIEKLQDKYRIYLLGGKEDEPKFSQWASKFKNVSGTGSLSLTQQVALISKMKAVISMDSGNMHLAAIQGVPVISIWGATHPCFGFSGIQTDPSSWISAVKEIPCRPCSVFGNKPCSNCKEPLACLNYISADSVITALEKAIR